MSAAKQKGTSFETLVTNYIHNWKPDAERRAMQGSLDKGDIFIPGEKRFVIECKNHKAFNLSGWVEEARTEAENAGVPFGVVIHKRRLAGQPGEQFVTMPLFVFSHLVWGDPVV